MGLRTWLRAKLSATPDHGADELFALHKYEVDGRFDYGAYRDAQIEKAQNDTGDVWADPKTLDLIVDHARKHIPKPSFVLCHGSKSGMESDYLAERLGCEGLGTDIAPPENAQRVVEWDFHEPKQEWSGRASLIYTNALDHSYDPKKALGAWVEQLEPGGLIYVEHTLLHGPQGAGESDPFGADMIIMPYLVLDWARGEYCVREIIKASHKKPHWKPTDGVRQETDLDVWVFVITKI